MILAQIRIIQSHKLSLLPAILCQPFYSFQWTFALLRNPFLIMPFSKMFSEKDLSCFLKSFPFSNSACLYFIFFYISSYFKIDYVFNYISLSSVLIVGQDVENILTYFVINDVINFLIQMVIFILVTLTRDRLAPCNTFDIILKHIRIHGLH